MLTKGEEYKDVPSPLLPTDLSYLPPTGSSQVIQMMTMMMVMMTMTMMMTMMMMTTTWSTSPPWGRRRWSRWPKKTARIRVTQFTERSFPGVSKSSG